MASQITEKWIRQRVGLDHDVVEDVRSLALPGTYHEKIGSLGRALLGFARLKNLDLSRNALSSLEGLESLKMLETLNLYYNNIPDLSELFRLRHNLNLQDLDLRLNPVVKNEPDYRLFCIHLLPSLKHLDDRPVRVAEKRAALMQFSIGNDEKEDEAKKPKSKKTNVELVSRKRLVASLAPSLKQTALAEDDCALIDLISQTGEDLHAVKELTGSTANEPAVSLHQLSDEEADQFPREAKEDKEMRQNGDHQSTNFVPNAEPISTLPGGQVRLHHARLPPPRRALFGATTASEATQLADPNLKFSDEADAYTSFATQGFFTANPRGENQETGKGEEEEEEKDTEDESSSDEDEEVVSEIPVNGQLIERATQQLLELTRQCGLRKGLELQDVRQILVGLYRVAVRDQSESEMLVRQQLDEMTQTAETLNGQLDEQRRATERLKRRVQRDRRAEEVLAEAEKEAASLRLHVQRLDEEKVALARDVATLKQEKRHTLVVPANVQEKLQELEAENVQLDEEVKRCQKERKQSEKDKEKVDSLVSMLQESHRALIANNGRLTRELDDSRRRHQHEVEQLHWSYEQLKRTLNATRNGRK